MANSMARVGIDIALTSLQKMAEEVDLFNGTGEFALFSNNGTIAAAGKHPGLIGKSISELHPDDYAEIHCQISKLAKPEFPMMGKSAGKCPIHYWKNDYSVDGSNYCPYS